MAEIGLFEAIYSARSLRRFKRLSRQRRTASLRRSTIRMTRTFLILTVVASASFICLSTLSAISQRSTSTPIVSGRLAPSSTQTTTSGIPQARLRPTPSIFTRMRTTVTSIAGNESSRLIMLLALLLWWEVLTTRR